MKDLEIIHLETERLILRQLNPGLYHTLFANCDDDEIKYFFGFTSNDELISEKIRHTNGLTTFNKSFLTFQLIDKNTQTIIGNCGFHTWYHTHYRAEIGYSLSADKYKGKGLMTEAFGAIIKYGFEQMNLNRIEAMIGPDNIPSIKLVQHFGFKQEGHLREHYFKNNKLEDSLVFALLKSEYSSL